MVKYCFSLVWMVRFRRRWLLRIVYCKGVYWALEIIECQVFIELHWISYVFHWTKHTQPLLKFSWPNLHAREDCLNISTADGCRLLLGRSVTGGLREPWAAHWLPGSFNCYRILPWAKPAICFPGMLAHCSCLHLLLKHNTCLCSLPLDGDGVELDLSGEECWLWHSWISDQLMKLSLSWLIYLWRGTLNFHKVLVKGKGNKHDVHNIWKTEPGPKYLSERWQLEWSLFGFSSWDPGLL